MNTYINFNCQNYIIMQQTPLTRREIEYLDYYDFMSYLGVPYFHFGGLKSTKELAELCCIKDQLRSMLDMSLLLDGKFKTKQSLTHFS